MNTNQSSPSQRILIIDDNLAIHDDFRKIFRPRSDSDAALSEAGAALFGTPSADAAGLHIQIDSAFQGEEGVILVQQALRESRPYPLAFVDVRMPPGMDGIETIDKIWKLDPSMQVVICTAHSDYSWAEMVARLPRPDQFLILKKPFDAIEVQQLAHALSEKWRLQKAAKFNLEFLQRSVDARTRVLETENAKLHFEIQRLHEALLQSESFLSRRN